MSGAVFPAAREIIRDTAVRYVVINYAQVEDERVICSRNWRKSHVKFTNQLKYQKLIYHPYFTRYKDHLQLGYKTMDYSFLPFQDRLALVELIDNAYCKYENKSSPEISRAVLQQTIDMIQQAGIKVILTSITGEDSSNKVLDQFKARGYHTLSYGINTGNREYNLMPADGHPNCYANRIFAAKLYEEIGATR